MMVNRQAGRRRRRGTITPTTAAAFLLIVLGCILRQRVQGFVVLPPPRSQVGASGDSLGRRTSAKLEGRGAFLPSHTTGTKRPSSCGRRGTSPLFVSTDATDTMDDETLLQTVAKPLLQNLCEQMDLPKEGTKAELLLRLRSHADAQAAVERDRRRKLADEIEAGVDGEGYPTKHRLVDGDSVDGGIGEAEEQEAKEMEEGVFYFEAPGATNNAEDAEAEASSRRVTVTDVSDKTDGKSTTTITTNNNDDDDDDSPNSNPNPITVPPPPPPDSAIPNSAGERVVTVYSTKDNNDMTAMNTESIMGEPGQEGMMGGYSRTDGTSGSGTDNPEDTLAGGPFGDTSGSNRRRVDEQDLDDAREAVTELVQGLLAMTGAPAFQDEFTDGLQPLGGGSDALEGFDLGSLGIKRSVVTSSQPQLDFVGFDPSNVPTDMLSSASKHVRAGGGQALREVLSDFEMQAIGHDGMAADDTSKGGGHYREVRKVGAFVEGYRRAEVRRVARETSSMLLDKLVTEGVKGLDLMLATTARGGDDGAGDAGEVNDSLLEYLNGAIRQQEKKVEQILGSQEQNQERRMGRRPTEGSIRRERAEDDTTELWKVKEEGGGQITESIDPNDPTVQRAVQRELERAKSAADGGAAAQQQGIYESGSIMPTTAPEQLLLLLTCLRDRVKAEAAFSTDEKGRNLRVLAYVLHAEDDREREGIITKELGSSLDRLDSFMLLLTSAIDYAASTSHRLQPSKGAPLNVALLKNIKSMVEDINERQAWKASGISTRDNK